VPSQRKRDSDQSTKGVPMTKVLAGITMSVDGYITGPNDGPGKGLGEGGERLHYWVFGGPWAYDSEPKGEPTGEDAAWLAEAVSRVGAVAGGRWTYEAAGHWGGENPWGLRSSSSRTGPRKRRRAERSRSCQVCRKLGARWGSVDSGDVGADQLCRLLVDLTLAAVGVVLLKARERSRRSDRVHFFIAVVVERHMHKGVIREPEDDVAHAVGLGSGQIIEDPFDSPLVLICCLRRAHCVARHEPLLHELLLSPNAGLLQVVEHGGGDKLPRGMELREEEGGMRLRALA
jgi:hypothetical protein